MHIQKKYSWQLSDSAVTPESVYLGRRHFLRTCGLGLVAGALLPRLARAATFGFPDSLNPAYKLAGIKLTSYDDITGYNNFYEWGLDKGDPKVNANRGWKTEPWTIEIGGLCAKPVKYDVNDLAFVATGFYGKPLMNQNGAPISLVLPWKYGFKGAKSLVRIDFVAEQPKTLWNEVAPNEYGFYANVNPEVDHPRWSQKTERIIAAGFLGGSKQTMKFNVS